MYVSLNAERPLQYYRHFHSNTQIYIMYIYFQGQASDIAIQAKEILKMRDAINQLYVKHCKQEIKAVGM